MTEHVKAGGAVAGATVQGERREFVVDMTIRVAVPAASPEEALLAVANTANWREWQWLEPRGVSERSRNGAG